MCVRAGCVRGRLPVRDTSPGARQATRQASTRVEGRWPCAVGSEWLVSRELGAIAVKTRVARRRSRRRAIEWTGGFGRSTGRVPPPGPPRRERKFPVRPGRSGCRSFASGFEGTHRSHASTSRSATLWPEKRPTNLIPVRQPCPSAGQPRRAASMRDHTSRTAR